MKKNLIGIFLSSLVFPGLGQLYLGKKGAGIAFIFGTNIGLAGILFSVFRKVPKIMAVIQPELERGVLNNQEIIELIRQSTQSSLLDTVSLTILTASWLLAIIHIIWLWTKQKDIQQT